MRRAALAAVAFGPAFDGVPELQCQARGHTEQTHTDAATMRHRRDDGSGPHERHPRGRDVLGGEEASSRERHELPLVVGVDHRGVDAVGQ